MSERAECGRDVSTTDAAGINKIYLTGTPCAVDRFGRKEKIWQSQRSGRRSLCRGSKRKVFCLLSELKKEKF